jgi:hypothetical protein
LTVATLGDVIRPGTTRGLDFVTLDELTKRTGINPDSILKFALGEMLCNALDKDSTEIGIDVQVEGDFYRLEVADDGGKKLSLKEIKLILDFENKASSKRGFLRVSRGYLGNALKSIFGYSYVLAESKGLTPPDITVKTGNRQYRIVLKPDRIKEVIESEIATTKREDDDFTTFIVKFPKDVITSQQFQRPHSSSPSVLDLVFATSIVNPTRKISYNLFNIEEGTLGKPQEGKAIRQETSVLWYTQKQFQSLYEDFVRVTPEAQLKEFIPLFRGFTSKKLIGEILQKLNSGNHDSGRNSTVQFFPATAIKDLPKEGVAKLFAAIRARAKPVAKRSIPSVLGVVGEKSFESLREQNGWERLKYVMLPGIQVECPTCLGSNISGYTSPCRSQDHVEFPYLIELAIFDRKNDDKEGLKVYQCVNFMASMEEIFSSRIFDINYRLGRVGISKDMPFTVVAHLVCPVLKWLNYGKSGLDE